MLEIAYEHGLEQLHDMIQRQAPDLLMDFNPLQQRLLDCLVNERRFGTNENTRAEKNRVLDQLMQFTNEHFGIQFIDLCRLESEPMVGTGQQQSTQMPPPMPLAHEIWKDGMEIQVQGARYLVDEPVTLRRATDRSALYQQARGQQADADRIVWIKQVQLHRDTAIAATWHSVLEKESRLLDRLEQQQDFPRRLAFEPTATTMTLVHSAVQGRSWAQIFDPSQQPLSIESTRFLLRSALSLCHALRLLHNQHCSHRALAPAHIILLDNGHTRLSDVGLAAWRAEPGEGPALYRAPEQRNGQQNLALPGPRTDIYQLGAILYHMITGQLPISSRPLPSLHTWNEQLSPEIGVVLERSLAPRVKERWRTIADFSFALKKALRTLSL
jgi:serine/threonine protein kinase